MSTYREIIGKKIKKVSSDPSSGLDGEMWYNSTTGTLRGLAIIEAWSSGSPLVTENYGGGGAGTQTAFLYWGGDKYPAPARTNETYEYNGSGWAAGGDYIGSVSYVGGCGTQTAAMSAGGFTGTATPTASAEYNGTSWTAGNSMSQQRMNTGASFIGIQTAAMVVGGDQYPSTPRSLTTCEEYDGTNWGSGGAYPVVIQNTGQGGPQTAGWAAGGLSDPAPGTPNTVRDTFNLYDGTNWTASTTLPGAMMRMGSAGTQTAALYFGGTTAGPTPVATTFGYDGSSWSAKPSLATARQSIAGGGVSSTSTAAIGAGGYAPSKTTAATEEWNSSTNTVTAGAWAANPALSYSVDANLASSGSLTSAVAAGGYNSPAGPGTVSYIANAATWNGTAWSNITDMPERRTNSNAVGATAPAFYVFGGQNMPGPTTNSYLTTTHTWNGSSWGSGPALAESQSGGGACGTPSAIVMVGGVNAPSSGAIDDNIQQYNGSSWSNSPVNYPTNISGNGACGTQTAAVIFGGHAGGSPFPGSGVTTTNEWNGSSISAANAMVFGLLGCSGSGTQTAALSYGGRNTAGNKNALGMLYDGTSWATSPNLGTARDYIALGPMGSSTGALAVAGSCPSQSLVEEFTGETTAVNIEDFTTS